ncbi:MAG: PorV/PorQ family protein, partial [Candidatus Electryoneaceae bacterium]|nr:PorV/PorQ family protein [Candidatus Electryoneaceae bacterium]
DIGVLYKTTDPLLGNPLSLGANLANLGTEMAYIDRAQADPIPTNLKFGMAWRLWNDGYFDEGSGEFYTLNSLTLAFDMNKLLVRKFPNGETDPFYIALFTAWTDEPFFYDLIYDVGLEYWYTDMVALRIGYWNDEIGKVKPFTYGASFKVSAYRFDFSYISEEKGHPLAGTTHLSLTVDF